MIRTLWNFCVPSYGGWYIIPYIIYKKKHMRKLLRIRSLLLSINISTCCSLLTEVGGCARRKVLHAEHTVQTSGKPFADLSSAFMQPHLLATSLLSFPNYPTDFSGSWNHEQTGSTQFHEGISLGHSCHFSWRHSKLLIVTITVHSK